MQVGIEIRNIAELIEFAQYIFVAIGEQVPIDIILIAIELDIMYKASKDESYLETLDDKLVEYADCGACYIPTIMASDDGVRILKSVVDHIANVCWNMKRVRTCRVSEIYFESGMVIVDV